MASSFIFTVATSDLTSIPDYLINPDTTINPIINNEYSFSELTNTIINNDDNTSTITWAWTGFTDNNSTNDGLVLNNSNFKLNVASLNIIQFGGIPLSRSSHQDHFNFLGQITATDTITVLNNTNNIWYFNIFTNTSIDYNSMTDTDIYEIATPYYRDGIFKLYHITLTKSNYYINYGFYKNGLLVDSTVYPSSF